MIQCPVIQGPVIQGPVIRDRVDDEVLDYSRCLLAQLRHRVTMVEDHPDTVEVRVVPFSSPGYPALGSSYHLPRLDPAVLGVAGEPRVP